MDFYITYTKGSGTPAIIFGPIGQNTSSLKSYTEKARSAGMGIILFDYIGSGHSAACSITGHDDLIGLNIRKIDGFLKLKGIKRIFVVGLCSGTGVAYRFSQETGCKVDRIVLYNPCSYSQTLSPVAKWIVKPSRIFGRLVPFGREYVDWTKIPRQDFFGIAKNISRSNDMNIFVRMLDESFEVCFNLKSIDKLLLDDEHLMFSRRKFKILSNDSKLPMEIIKNNSYEFNNYDLSKKVSQIIFYQLDKLETAK